MFKNFNKYKAPYLFISPFFILFFTFQLIPVIWTVYISFTSWNGLKAPKWVGLDNYSLMIQDYMVHDALFNTMFYWIGSIIIIMTISTSIALALNSIKLKGKKFFKTATFLPYVCASIAMGLIFGMIFDENAGILNEILVSLGFDRVGWLTSSKWAKIPVLILFNWRLIPWFTIIIYSALLSISKEYYEAAKVDGANVFQQFVFITLPALQNIFFFCTLSITSDVWKMFNESFILSGPGTSNASLFELIYEYGFTTFKLGYASSLSVLLIVIMLIVSIIQVNSRRRNGDL